MKRSLASAALLALAACSVPAEISSFEDCVLAGYPVMESYPRRCRVPNGPTFTEAIPPVVSDLATYNGTFQDHAVDDDGTLTFRFRSHDGEDRVVLEPDATVHATGGVGAGTGADLRAVASGTTLNVRGWKDDDGVIHAVEVRLRR